MSSDTPPRRRREEAVQGAGMGGLFHAPGAAESDASVRLWVRSHVPGSRRDRAPAEEAGIRKAKPKSDCFRRNPPMGRLHKGFGP
jgi:hypothetical protein